MIWCQKSVFKSSPHFIQSVKQKMNSDLFFTQVWSGFSFFLFTQNRGFCFGAWFLMPYHITAADLRSYETQTKFASVVILQICRCVEVPRKWGGDASADVIRRRCAKSLMRLQGVGFCTSGNGFAKERIRKTELSTLHHRSKTIFTFAKIQKRAK